MYRSSVRNTQDKGFLSSRDEVVLIMSVQASDRSDDGSIEDSEQVDYEDDEQVVDEQAVDEQVDDEQVADKQVADEQVVDEQVAEKQVGKQVRKYRYEQHRGTVVSS